jgi:hypothetical protein
MREIIRERVSVIKRARESVCKKREILRKTRENIALDTKKSFKNITEKMEKERIIELEKECEKRKEAWWWG